MRAWHDFCGKCHSVVVLGTATLCILGGEEEEFGFPSRERRKKRLVSCLLTEADSFRGKEKAVSASAKANFPSLGE